VYLYIYDGAFAFPTHSMLAAAAPGCYCDMLLVYYLLYTVEEPRKVRASKRWWTYRFEPYIESILFVYNVPTHGEPIVRIKGVNTFAGYQNLLVDDEDKETFSSAHDILFWVRENTHIIIIWTLRLWVKSSNSPPPLCLRHDDGHDNDTFLTLLYYHSIIFVVVIIIGSVLLRTYIYTTRYTLVARVTIYDVYVHIIFR